MDQRIFDLNLSVPATSLYLLMVPLAEAGVALTGRVMASYWNGAPQEMDSGLKELARHRVISEETAGEWRLLPPEKWLSSL